ncbi:hypothetical protein JB92DRAFT_2800471 [Gautieria morchelliformis]|nr:hypothetical protein JB92DRAFT_2800471 [Gautieria morchelliformis]
MRLAGDPYAIPHHAQRSNPSGRNRGPDLPPIAQHPRHSPRRNTAYPSTSNSNNLHAYASTSQPQPPAHSYHLSNHPPNQGVIRQGSSAQDDLDASIPQPASEPTRRYKDDEGGKGLLYPSGLKKHSRKNTGDLPYECGHPGCGKRFPRSYSLTRHMRTHIRSQPCTTDNRDRGTPTGQTTQSTSPNLASDPRPYKCDVCSKGFLYPSGLKIHSMQHTGDRPYTCEHPGCNKRFSQSSNMRRHMSTHIRFQPYTTDNRDRGTPTGQTTQSTSPNLASDPRPYKCDVCSKGFLYPSGLKNHSRTHSGDLP